MTAIESGKWSLQRCKKKQSPLESSKRARTPLIDDKRKKGHRWTPTGIKLMHPPAAVHQKQCGLCGIFKKNLLLYVGK